MNPPRSPASNRPFTLVDAMVLVAAAAAGFGLVRGWLALRSQPPQFDGGTVLRGAILADFDDWYTAARLILLVLTMAVIPLGLRHSVPTRLGRWSRPGMIVPFAVALAALACLLGEQAFPLAVGLHAVYATPAHRLYFIISEAVSIGRTATAIGVAWLTLALAGRWEREDDWVGRLGRALGFAWIGTCLGCRAYELVMYWWFGYYVPRLPGV
jgi:hypothetical protein